MPKKTALIRDGSTGPLGTARRPALKQALLASAAVIALMGTHLSAQALALGAITVRSALGEPLRAEIAIPQISSEEASTLQATLGSPEAFRAAGVDYNAGLAGARVTLHRRADGQAYLRVVGNRPINEPFLGVVIEASWAAGKIVRDYTMLIDPPQHAPAASVVSTPPQAAAPAARPAVAEQVRPAAAARPAARRRAAPMPPPAVAPASGGGQVTVQRGDTASSIARAHAVDGASLDQMLVALLQANPNAFIRGNVNLVKAGAVLQLPTAEQAQAVARADARRTVRAQSRDFQTYRRGLAQAAPAADATTAASRSASGSVQAEVKEPQAAPAPADRLTVSKGGAASGSEAEAALSRQAQEQAERVAELDKNLSELKRLQSSTTGSPAAAAAGAAAGASTAAPGLEVPVAGGGAVVAPSAPAGAVVPAPAADATPAPAADAAAAPTTPSTDTAAAPAAEASAPAETPAAGESTTASATPAAGDNAGTTETQPSSDTAATTDSAPAAATDTAAAEPPAAAAPAEEEKPAPAPAAAAPAPAPAATPSFLDTLMENPLLPVGGAALIALLAGLGIYRSRQRKKQEASMDSEFIESRLQPDSFFGASGGQRVNTQEGISRSGASSMSYSPSQLDAAGDVDPVAEADVYLAYGRDMQAEEILKEALLVHPRRASLHRKLAEIYAKRRDPRALEAIANEAYAATEGEGPEWQAIASLGAELDADNPLYQPGGKPRPKSPVIPQGRQYGADTERQSMTVALGKQPEGETESSLDLSLDSADQSRQAPLLTAAHGTRQFGADTEPQSAALILGQEPAGTDSAPLDLSLDSADQTRTSPLEPKPASDSNDTAKTVALGAAASAVSDAVDLDLGLDFTPPAQPSAPAPAPAAASTSDLGNSGMIEFDMSALAVDPDTRSGSDIRTEQPEDADEDPLSTKLSLAQEFRSIGDVEGARSLAQEVVAEATGALKIKAERFLAEL